MFPTCTYIKYRIWGSWIVVYDSISYTFVFRRLCVSKLMEMRCINHINGTYVNVVACVSL